MVARRCGAYRALESSAALGPCPKWVCTAWGRGTENPGGSHHCTEHLDDAQLGPCLERGRAAPNCDRPGPRRGRRNLELGPRHRASVVPGLLVRARARPRRPSLTGPIAAGPAAEPAPRPPGGGSTSVARTPHLSTSPPADRRWTTRGLRVALRGRAGAAQGDHSGRARRRGPRERRGQAGDSLEVDITRIIVRWG